MGSFCERACRHGSRKKSGIEFETLSSASVLRLLRSRNYIDEHVTAKRATSDSCHIHESWRGLVVEY